MLLSFMIGASIPITAVSNDPSSSATVNYGGISGEVLGTTNQGSLSLSSPTPVDNAVVCAYDPITQTVLACTRTDAYGLYAFSVEAGNYSVYADKDGYYRTTHVNVEVTAGDVAEIDLTLEKIPEEESGWIYGETYTTSSSTDSFYKIPLQGVSICITSISDSYLTADESCTHSNSNGDFKIYADEGNYKVTASKTGYYPSSLYVPVEEGKGAMVEFNLLKRAEPPANPDTGSIYGRILGIDSGSGGASAAISLSSVTVSIMQIGGQIIESSSGDSSVKVYRITSEDGKLVSLESKITNMAEVKATPPSLNPSLSEESLTSSEPITRSISYNFWQTTLTDENGEYKFTLVEPQETYSIRVSKYGYETSAKTVTLEDIAEVNFVLTKRSDISTTPSDPIKITVINESLVAIREIGGEQNTQKIDTAIYAGFVGGELLIENNLESDIVLYDELLSISTLSIDHGSISLVINGDDDLPGGKTIVINAEKGVFDENGNIMLTYDGETILTADDFTDILNPNDDNYRAEYLIVEGSNGIQILVSIPHFSSHAINIYSMVEALGGTTAVMFYIVTCIIAASIFTVSVFVRKKV